MSDTLHIDKDLQTMLTFYHDLGRIIYFGSLSRDKRALNDVVILDPQWLVEVFKQVITIAKPRDMVRSNKYLLLRFPYALLNNVPHTNTKCMTP